MGLQSIKFVEDWIEKNKDDKLTQPKNKPWYMLEVTVLIGMTAILVIIGFLCGYYS